LNTMLAAGLNRNETLAILNASHIETCVHRRPRQLQYYQGKRLSGSFCSKGISTFVASL
jgi:hypothetical protein